MERQNENQPQPRPQQNQSQTQQNRPVGRNPQLRETPYLGGPAFRSPSELTRQTLWKVLSRLQGRTLRPPNRHYFHDNTSCPYSWLLPGWIVEERVMEHGRQYKYFYDPEGNMYSTKNAVLAIYERWGVGVSD